MPEEHVVVLWAGHPDHDARQGPLVAGPAEVAIPTDRPLVRLLVVDQSFRMLSKKRLIAVPLLAASSGAQDLLAHRLVQQERAARARRDALQARGTAPNLFYVST